MPTKTLKSPWLAALLAPAFLAACAAKPEEPPRPAEPAAALRPEGLRGEVPPEARIADYVLEAHLDTETHQVEGNARVTWRNTTERSVETLPFHLYMNGFRSESTAWMRSSGGSHRGHQRGKDTPWGYIDVHSVELEHEGPLLAEPPAEHTEETVELAYAEDADPSTMTVTLPRPVAPGEAVTVALDFTTQLPEVYSRTGYKDDLYAVGQWFPKVGVLDEDGWNAHTFTYNDEFYADFGSYTVFLDVPEDMVVGATGTRTSEEVADGRKHLTYEAEMVHDFAWFADPDFVERYGDYNGVRIRQLLQPERVDDAEAHLEAQLSALASYEKRFGPYPWSTLTIIHVPEDARGAGGMEYPTLFTTGERAPLPGWVRENLLDVKADLFTTVHEFGHQYFQGLFASREHSEPWLDEGVNSFSNYLAFIDWQGEDPAMVEVLGHPLRLSDLASLMISGTAAYLGSVDRPASAFPRELGNYSSTIYSKTAAILMTLRNLVGAEDFDRAFAVYAERARFRHPHGADLVRTLVEQLGGRVDLAASGEPPVDLDVGGFLEQALETTRRVDFEVYSVRNRRRLGEEGYQRGEDGTLARNDLPEEGEEKEKETDVDDLPDEETTGEVVIYREGDFEVPVEVLVEFTDGGEELRLWDARDETVVWTWPGRRVRRARIDPERKLALERDRLDNVRYARDQEGDHDMAKTLDGLAEAVVLAVEGGLAQ